MSALRGAARAIIPRGVRNLLRTPGRSLGVAGHELLHLARRNAPLEVRPGWTLRCHPTVADFVVRNQVRDREQAAELDAFIASARPGMVLFDIGAHYGTFALAALHFGGPDARAFAVEPSPAAARLARIQARLNGAGERMRVVHAAAAAAPGRLGLVTTGPMGDAFVVQRQASHPEAELTYVRAVAVDDLARELGAAPTHLKVDVEGAEADVLRGARRVLAGADPPLLLLELHNELIRAHGGDPDEVPALLREAGYRAYGLDGAPVGRESMLAPSVVRLVARRG